MALFAGNIDNLRSLYTTQLRYLQSTEEQITKGLAKMIDTATDTQLKKALEAHREETRQQSQRLDQILRDLKAEDHHEKCDVTAALIAAAETTMKAAKDNAVRDVGIIASAQKIEHFEIASYGTARTWARILGETQHAQLLQQTLQEEEHADRLLTSIAEQRNLEAAKAA